MIFLLVIGWHHRSHADVVSSEWLGTTDQFWGTNTNWDPAIVPRNGADSFNVTLPAALASPVVANGSFTVDSVTVGGGSALEIDNANTLTVTGFLNNDGSILPSSTGSNSTIFISGSAENTVTFGGTGDIVLDAATDRIIGSTNHVLVNTPSHSIRGGGVIGANLINLINQGRIIADDPTEALKLDPRSTLVNEGGTLSASSGGTLELKGGTFTSNGDGNFIVADGSTIVLAGAEIVSSIFEIDDQDNDIANNRFLVTSGSTVSDVTNHGTVSISNGITLTVAEGGLINHGDVASNSTGSNSGLSITGGGEEFTMTIGGRGTITLNSVTDRIVGATNHTLVHEAGHTIRGAGVVGFNLINFVNRGSIRADDSTGSLELDPRISLSNEGGLFATDGGRLRLLGGTYISSGEGRFQVADNSIIELAGADIVSSSLEVDDQDGDLSNNGVLVSANSSFSEVTNHASVSISNGRTLTLGEGGFMNHGMVTVESSTSTTGLSILGGGVENTTTINGSGSIVLDSTTERIVGATNHRLVQESGHTIRGAGAVCANLINLVNRGVISADDAMGQLVIDPRVSLSNEGGTLSAVEGGTLRLLGGTYTSSGGGRLLVGDHSSIELAGAEIDFSPLDIEDQDGDPSNNSISVTGNSTLSSVTNRASMSIENGRTLSLGSGGLTNHGVLVMDSTGSNTSLGIMGEADSNTVTVGGGGSIDLDAPTERIIGSVNHTLVNDSAHTIRGAGAIGVNLINVLNKGTIAADIESAELLINVRTGAFVNEGSLSATGGGILTLADPLVHTDGLFNVGTASSASVSGAVTQSGGVATINGLLSADSYDISEGILSGSGTLDSTLSSDGAATVSPTGLLTVNDVVTLGGGTTFLTSVASASSADRLNTSAELILAETSLQVTYSGTTSNLTAADTVTVASSDVALTGRFSNAVDGARIISSNNLASFEVKYTSTAVTLTGVDHAPTFTGEARFSIAENAPAGTSVGIVEASDIEGGRLVYSLMPGTPFAIDAASGRITSTAALDFETQSVYSLSVIASDGTLSRETMITIEVMNILEDNREIVAHYLTRSGGAFEGESDPAIIGIGADPDGDGRGNIFELWLGSDPAKVDSSPAEPILKIVAAAGSSFGAEEISVIAELDDLLTIDSEVTFDLENWRSATSSRTVLSESNGRRTVEFTDAAPLVSPASTFAFRFRADPAGPNRSL